MVVQDTCTEGAKGKKSTPKKDAKDKKDKDGGRRRMKELGKIESFEVTGAQINIDISSKEVALEGDDGIIGKAIVIKE